MTFFEYRNLYLLALSIALIGISACRDTIPDNIDFEVNNGTDTDIFSYQNEVCEGGLEARVEVGSLIFESPRVVAGENFAENKLRPGNASSGAFVELEARCYGEAGTEIGYIQLEKRWQADASKSIYIFGPAPEDGSGNFDCLEGDTETGQVPCVWSPLLE